MTCDLTREEQHAADLLNCLKVEGYGYTSFNFSLIFAIHCPVLAHTVTYTYTGDS